MLKFSPEKLFDEYCQQYVIEFGQSKFDKVVSTIHSSSNVSIYINNVIRNSSMPTNDNIQTVLHTHTFFLWAKEETVCLGGLGIIAIWINQVCSEYDEDQERFFTEIMASFINKSSRLKFNIVNNFFDRFFRRLVLIERGANGY